MQNSSPVSALLRWRHFRLALSLSHSLSLSLSLSLCISLSLSLSLWPSAPSAHYRKRSRAFLNIADVIWAVAKETALSAIFAFFKKNRFEILKKIQAMLRVPCFENRIGWPKGDKKHEKRLRFFVGFAHCVCFVVSTRSSRRLSTDRVYSSSTAAVPTAEFLGEDDRDYLESWMISRAAPV